MRLPPTRSEIEQINAREAERLRQQRAVQVDALSPRAVPNAKPIPFDPNNPDPVAEAHLRLAEARRAVQQGQSPVDYHIGQPQKITAHVVDIGPLQRQAARAAVEKQWEEPIVASGPLKRIGLQLKKIGWRLIKDAHLEKLADEVELAMREQRNLFLDNSTATSTPERIAGENRTIEIAEVAVRESITSWLARRPTGELIHGPQTPLVNLTRRQEGVMSVIRDEKGYEVRPETDARVLTVGRQAVSLLREVKYADAEVARTINKLFLDFALRFPPNILGTAAQTPELESLQREFEKSMQAVLQPLLAKRSFAPGKAPEKNAQFLASDLWFFVPQLSLQLKAEEEKLLKLYTGVCPAARQKEVRAQLEKYLNATLCISVQLHQQTADLQARLPARLQGVFQRTPPPVGEIEHLPEVAHIGGQNPRIATPPVEAFTQEQQAQAREAKPERSPDVQVISMNNQEEFNRLYQELLKFQAANRARAALAAPRRIILVGSWFFKDWDYTLSKQVGVMPGKKAKGKSEMVAATPKQRLNFLVNFLQMGENNKIPCLIVYSEEQVVVSLSDRLLAGERPPDQGTKIISLEEKLEEAKKKATEKVAKFKKDFYFLKTESVLIKKSYDDHAQTARDLKQNLNKTDITSLESANKVQVTLEQVPSLLENLRKTSAAATVQIPEINKFAGHLETARLTLEIVDVDITDQLVEIKKECFQLNDMVKRAKVTAETAVLELRAILENARLRLFRFNQQVPPAQQPMRPRPTATPAQQPPQPRPPQPSNGSQQPPPTPAAPPSAPPPPPPMPPPMPPRPPKPEPTATDTKNPADAKSAFGDLSDLNF